MKIYVEETHLLNKNYIAASADRVVNIASGVKEHVNDWGDELIISELSNCMSVLENLLDNMTYKS